VRRACVRRACVRRACVLVAAAVALAGSVAGCVNMPDSGPMGAISATPQSTAAAGEVIEPFPSKPTPGESPKDIVTGFLAASASYPVNQAIAREYLTTSASKPWSPGWRVTVFNTLNVTEPAPASRPGTGRTRATIQADGTVQSAFNGSGQFVAAQNKDKTANTWPFSLTKVSGQWRIVNPPNFRLLTVSQFQEFYRAQNLYFINPSITSTTNLALIPDSVFVPVGTLATDLADNLVNALLPASDGQPKSTLLQGAANPFPGGTKVIGVTLDGTTAVVNLSGLDKATSAVRMQVSAQLAWTLASPRVPGPPAAIQSIELELNGKPWTPPNLICGSNQIRSPVQTQATYPCYNPYPSQPSGFSFTGHGQVWWRCSAETRAQQGSVGQVVSVFHTARGASAPSCGEYVPTDSTATPPPVSLPSGSGMPSIAAISPDGNYVAYYSPDTKAIFAGPVSSAAALRPVPGVTGAGVAALSWDRDDDLWIAQNGNVLMAPLNGKAAQIGSAPADVTDLSVAPDGVRVAMVVQVGSSSTEVDLTAIIPSGGSSQGHLGSLSEAVSVGSPVQLGPDLVHPDTLTWYDADNLIVLAGISAKQLAEVPVDGQGSSNPQFVPDGTVSITADGSQNALIAGLSGSRLAVSTGLEGPWQFLTVLGQNPAYPG
jgi:hypothetical protein